MARAAAREEGAAASETAGGAAWLGWAWGCPDSRSSLVPGWQSLPLRRRAAALRERGETRRSSGAVGLRQRRAPPRRGRERVLTGSSLHRLQPHHQLAGLPLTGWSGEGVGCSAAGVSGASQAPRASVEGWPATCVTHGSPDAARCEEAPEPTTTGAQVATPRTTGEGVTPGGQSVVGDGLHAAEALTPSSPRQAVRGQESKAQEGPASQADSAASSQGSGQRRAPLLSPALSCRIMMVGRWALE